MQRISSRHCSSECLGLCAIEEEAKTIISSEFVNTNLKVIAGHQLIHEHYQQVMRPTDPDARQVPLRWQATSGIS